MDEAPLNTIIGFSEVHFDCHETNSLFFIVQGVNQFLGYKNIDEIKMRQKKGETIERLLRENKKRF